LNSNSNNNNNNNSSKSIRGKVHKYDSDNIDTDVIIPGPYLKIHDHNFGCGSSREHAPIALSQTGIKAILAQSFARIFYRNSVDGGYLLPLEIDASTVKKISDGDELMIDIVENKITNITKNEDYLMKPFPELIAKIVEAGGLINYKPD
jgi:3-isopropylmalate/(R)-2-methylmalate dehydratase small subunit